MGDDLRGAEPGSKSEETCDAAIVGGGLAGLSMAILLARRGHRVVVFEKDAYPRQKVCGEYISAESEAFMRELGVPLAQLDPPRITRFVLTSPFGHAASCRLAPGGLGIRRYRLDALLAELAAQAGAQIRTRCQIRRVAWDPADERWHVEWAEGAGNASVRARVALGAWGRAAPPQQTVPEAASLPRRGQSLLQLHAEPRRADSPTVPDSRKAADPRFIGVKTHVDRGPESDTIEIHHFEGGYAGISQVEDGTWCLCYLADARHLRPHGNDFEAFEARVLSRNPYLRERLRAEPLHPRVTTSRIRFGLRAISEGFSTTRTSSSSSSSPALPLLGDSSGFIPPITGNGMSLAFRSTAQLYPHVRRVLEEGAPAAGLEHAWSAWHRGQLDRRIRNGVRLQNLLFRSGPARYRLLMAGLTRVPGGLNLLTKLAVGREIRLPVLGAFLTVLLAAFSLGCAPHAPAEPDLMGDVTMFHTGGADVSRDVSGGLCMMGGGPEVDSAMRWFLRKAGGGDVVVVRASGSDGYQRYLYRELGVEVNSVTTLRFDGPSAGPAALEILANAEAIWIAGGDQQRYLELWMDAPVGDALQAAVDRGAAIGGTSAGMAVLGEHIWDGESLRTGFLRVLLLAGIITDTHVDTRGREPRHAQWVRSLQIRAIAADEQAGLCVETDPDAPGYGVAQIHSPPERARRIHLLHVDAESGGVVRETLTHGARFDVAAWKRVP